MIIMNGLWKWFHRKNETKTDDKKVNMIGVLYAIRCMDAYDGSYFKFSKQKAICNPNEMHKYYLKVGAVTYADPIKIEGKKCKEINETFRYTGNKFGNYVFYSKTQQKLRTIACARKNGFPGNTFPYGIGLLHSIIPRYDGYKLRSVIVGVEIHYQDNSSRQWTRFDGKFKGCREHEGFTELEENSNFIEIVQRRVKINGVNFTIDFGVCIIYLSTNASLVMHDYTNPDLGDTSFRNRMNTLFQSGSIIICRSNLEFRFYGIEEGDSIKPQEMVKPEISKLMPHTVNYHKLNNARNNFAIILNSTESGAFWSLRVPLYKKPRYRLKKPAILCIPTDGEFEAVYGLMEGLEEIGERMKDKPWKKYIRLADSDGHSDDIDAFTDITDDISVYP